MSMVRGFHIVTGLLLMMMGGCANTSRSVKKNSLTQATLSLQKIS